MRALIKAGIAITAMVLFVLFFLFVPVVSFSCSNGLFTTTGSVSLSCDALGFGEIHEQALGISSSGWSDNCQIPSGTSMNCSATLATIPVRVGD